MRSRALARRVLRPRRHHVGEAFACRYRLDALIGEGGMCDVWRAHCLLLDEDIALKVVRADRGGPRNCARLTREARATTRLAHPSMVRAIDFGTTTDDEAFLVMELLEGPSLLEWSAKQRRVMPTEAVRLVLPLASALSHAHGLGIAHCDVKPANVILTRGPRGGLAPKLVDFGIARVQGDPDQSALDTDSGAAMGSLDYMSPEQVEGSAAVDGRSDQWSLCVLLYELLTGHRPFAGSSQRAVIFSIVAGAPEPITKRKAGDEALWAILRRGLQKNPEDRWPNVAELRRALALWAMQRGVASDAAGTPIYRLLGSFEDASSSAWSTPPPAQIAPVKADREEIPPSQVRARLNRVLAAVGLFGVLAVGLGEYADHDGGSTDGRSPRAIAHVSLAHVGC